MRITREQAIKEVGIEAVRYVEMANVEPTNRVTSGTKDHGSTEFSAYVPVGDFDDLVVYVFVDDEALDGVEELDQLDWPSIFDNTAEFELA